MIKSRAYFRAILCDIPIHLIIHRNVYGVICLVIKSPITCRSGKRVYGSSQHTTPTRPPRRLFGGRRGSGRSVGSDSGVDGQTPKQLGAVTC